MTPLEAYLSSRLKPPVLRRIAWDRRCEGLPPWLGNFVSRKLWHWPYRHMRAIPRAVGFDSIRPGKWRITHRGDEVTTTAPLSEWIGRIDRPVTIVAGGPSARDYPIQRLAAGNRFVVAVNGVPAFLAERGIRPDAWIVSDPRLGLQTEANFPHAPGTPLALTSSAAASIASRSPKELAQRPLCLIERVNQWHGVPSLDDDALVALSERSGSPFVFPAAGVRKSIVGWSHQPQLGFFSGATVAYAALQIVIWLGARDIEIIGMDLCGNGHSYREGAGAFPSTLAGDYPSAILPSFELMREALDGTGIVIRNLSPVCPLPARIFSS